MEISSFSSLNDDMGMEDLVFCQEWSVLDYSINELMMSNMPNCALMSQDSYNNINITQQYSVLDFKQAPQFSSQYHSSRPLKQLKTTTTWNSSCKPENVSFDIDKDQSSINISRSKSCSSYGKQNYVFKSCQGAKRISTTNVETARVLPCPEERVLAERKRREKLNQRFIALSALLPQLKKMDKASILEDAIKYLKKLQDKVNILDQVQKSTNDDNKNNNKKRSSSSATMESSSSDESNSSGSTIIDSSSLPEIETRVSNKDVLIQILCHKKKGVLEKTVGEIEKLNLSVVNSSIMTFGDSVLNISLVAQMDEKVTLDIKELVKNLHGALSR